MEQINGISIPFYKFTCDPKLTLDVLEDVKTKNFVLDSPVQGNILFDYFHEELFCFFEDSINQVKNLYYNDKLDFPIVDCWVNEYLPLTRLKRHNHMNSVICGLFYLTSHDNSLPTIFEYENPWTHNDSSSNISVLGISKNPSPIKKEIYPESGTLILFPASIFHYMDTIKPNGSIHRYTIAFNTYPSGIISNIDASKLELKSISLREKIKGSQK